MKTSLRIYWIAVALNVGILIALLLGGNQTRPPSLGQMDQSDTKLTNMAIGTLEGTESKLGGIRPDAIREEKNVRQAIFVLYLPPLGEIPNSPFEKENAEYQKLQENHERERLGLKWL